MKILDIGIAWNYQAQAEEEILESIKFYPNLNPFFKKLEESCLSIGEDKILDQNENVLIISADPGMGKSTILDNLIQATNSDQFFIKIILNDHTAVFKKIKDKNQKSQKVAHNPKSQNITELPA